VSCPHDFQPVSTGSRVYVCMRCATVTFDAAPQVRITPIQATALGFARNDYGLLEPLP
jgi:hypothetical protein